MSEGQIADADGDGVADSRWVVIPDVNSSKGKPIYAAIRIIDNGGMMNVNTAYKFNPNDPDPNVISMAQANADKPSRTFTNGSKWYACSGSRQITGLAMRYRADKLIAV